MSEKEYLVTIRFKTEEPKETIYGIFENYNVYSIEETHPCPKCGSIETVKLGTVGTIRGGIKQRYKCKKCHHVTMK
jgi:transposase-like protein